MSHEMSRSNGCEYEDEIFLECIPEDGGNKKSKAVPLHAMEALGGRGDISLTHSRPPN
jgi:hypothetical protein